MSSKLARIEVPKNWGPFDILRDWLEDFKTHSKISFVVFNLATSSKTGEVKNRFVGLQKLADDGLIFNTNPNSPKVQHLKENPNVAASFLFTYSQNNSRRISRQVRIEGVAEKCPNEVSDALYHLQPLYAKIRSALIPEQGVQVEWDDLKKKHDDLLDKVDSGELELKPPNNLVAYKIVPKSFDFYHASENEIADRILFTCDSGVWSYCHITA